MNGSLPPIPVDDNALDLIEQALDAYIDEDGNLAGSDFGLHRLLDFWAGYDEAKVVVIEEPSEGRPGLSEYVGSLYHPNDVIRALVNEVRRLRALLPPALHGESGDH